MKEESHKNSEISIFISLVLLALTLRLLLLYISNYDIKVVFADWYDQFIRRGHFGAFSEIFYNYSPAYLYLIDFMTLFRFIPKEQALKIIPIIFDFVAAFAVLKLVEIKYPKGYMRFLGFFIILFTPTIFVESGMWGQCDIVNTSFLLWSLYFIFKEKPFYAILFLSLGVAFKLQALFFAPLFGILFLRKKFPFYLFFVIPVVYFISVIPAWLAGAPLVGLLKIYMGQFNEYQLLSLKAPNLYIFMDSANDFDTKVLVGLIVTTIIIGAYIILRWQKWKELDDLSLLFDVAFFTFITPFLLPKMHDRYFFTGGVFLILLAIHNKKLIGLAVMLQVSSLLSYIPYFSRWPDIFSKIGAIINCLLIVWFLVLSRNHWVMLTKTDPLGSDIKV